MARRPMKNDIPKKTKPVNSGIFKPQARAAAPDYPKNHKNGGPHTGLTMNRQKPGGGHGSAGPTTSVD